MAATLLILRATELLDESRSHDAAVKLAIALYVLYNIAAAVVSPSCRTARRPTRLVRVFGSGVACFALAYGVFAVNAGNLAILAVAFTVAGVGIGLVETAEHAAVATFASDEIRGSAFGLLAAVQSLGNLAASAIVGVLYTVASPTVAFVYAAAVMMLALGLSIATGRATFM